MSAEQAVEAEHSILFVAAVRHAGVTHRQADYWGRVGYVHVMAKGSGVPSKVSAGEANVMAVMGRLTRAGLLAGVAARIARTVVEEGVESVALAEGISVRVERAEVEWL